MTETTLPAATPGLLGKKQKPVRQVKLGHLPSANLLPDNALDHATHKKVLRWSIVSLVAAAIAVTTAGVGVWAQGISTTLELSQAQADGQLLSAQQAEFGDIAALDGKIAATMTSMEQIDSGRVSWGEVMRLVTDAVGVNTHVVSLQVGETGSQDPTAEEVADPDAAASEAQLIGAGCSDGQPLTVGLNANSMSSLASALDNLKGDGAFTCVQMGPMTASDHGHSTVLSLSLSPDAAQILNLSKDHE